MARPIISWLDKDLNTLSKLQFTSEEGSFSSIVADTESVVSTVYIANNFTKNTAAAEAVSDATDCQLKVTATDGTIEAPVVKEKWIHAKCTTNGDIEYTRLGYDVETTTEIKLNISAGDETRPNTISGGANDGTITGTGIYNAAKVELMAKPDLNTEATGGLQSFRLVLIYSYGAA